MNIALICYVYPPETQSAGPMTRDLAEHLAGQGHRVTVITGFPSFPGGVLFPGWRRHWRRREPGDGFEVMRVWHSLGMQRSLLHRLCYYATFALSCAVAVLRMGRVDSIWDISPPIVGNLVVSFIARMKRARHFYVNWDVYPEIAIDMGMLRPGRLARIVGRLDTFLCNHAARVLVLAKPLRDVLTRRGVQPGKVAVLPLWTTLTPDPLPPRLNTWRSQHGIDAASFVVLYAGTVGMLNGADVLVRAALHLADRPDVMVVVVGDGSDAPRVRAEAQRLEAHNVRFMPLQPRAVVPEMLAAADVCVVTLRAGCGQTCAPSKLLAYMDASRPVVASVDSGSATADWVTESGCGVVVPGGDDRLLADALRSLQDSPATRARLGQAGRAHVRSRLSAQQVVPLYADLLTEGQVAPITPSAAVGATADAHTEEPSRAGPGEPCTGLPRVAARPVGFAKRALDVAASATLLLILSPALAVIALLVRLSSPGPVIFRQVRVGHGGRPFHICKFRTMRALAGGAGVTAGDDARITPIGVHLRRWKMDELPQLLNVLRGEMSLVGPRPEVPRYVAHYTAEQAAVLAVRPGITGPTQLEFRDEEQMLAGHPDVEGHYLTAVMPAKLALDLRYASEANLWTDLRVLVRTAGRVARLC